MVFVSLWPQLLLKNLGIHDDGPMKLYCDNKATISVAHNLVQHDKIKHIEIEGVLCYVVLFPMDIFFFLFCTLNSFSINYEAHILQIGWRNHIVSVSYTDTLWIFTDMYWILMKIIKYFLINFFY